MAELLKEITQISIYLKEKAERVNEVALFQPLLRKSQFNEESKPIAARKWRYTSNLSFFRRLSLKFKSLAYHYFPPLIPTERLTPEAKFKTVLALLLAQEEVRDFFLGNAQRQSDFFQALSQAAVATGYLTFSSPTLSTETPLTIGKILTKIKGKTLSLIEDLSELNLQMAALSYHERNEILYRILNRVERPPITSVIEITTDEITQSVPLTTRYAKYKIASYDSASGQICYTCAENQATSSIRTLKNSLPNAKGAMNQRIAFEAESGERIGSYCGELTTPFYVMEQILLLLGQTGSVAQVRSSLPEGAAVQETKILFSSLYSWDEFSLISDQQEAIRKWDQKIVECDGKYFRLNLLYFNISFNALNKYPTPAEIKACLQDINDETYITLVAEACRHVGVECEELKGIASRTLSIREWGESRFIERKKMLLEEVDRFRVVKEELVQQITSLPASPFTQALVALLLDKKCDDKPLKGIDKLLYLDYLAKDLGYLHNKNCRNATDRSAGANAADKAVYAYEKIYKHPFLPGIRTETEAALFKVLYSMYLVWEEPEINTWLSTGFMGEKFYKNFFQKNPETTRYLVRWLKKHPETYLGLSDYRT